MASPSHDEAASSSVIAFLVAGTLFMASIAAVLIATRDSSDARATGDSADVARANLQATALADILLASPGYFHAQGSSTPSPLDWSNAASYNGHTLDAERLDRLGLLDADASERFMMDYAKFQNLRRAGYYANATNGFVDYEEAVATLGLQDTVLDFHVRAYPTLDSLQKLLSSAGRDPNLRVTYVGDIEVHDTTSSGPAPPPTEGLTFTTPVCSKDPATSTPYAFPSTYRIQTTIHNGGSLPTQFTAVTTASLGGDPQNQNTNGYLVLPGGDVTLSIDVPAVAYGHGSNAGVRSCAAGRTVTFDLYDPVHGKLTPLTNAGTGASAATITATFGTDSTAVTGVPSVSRGMRLDTDLQNYRPTQSVVLNYDGANMAWKDKLFLRVCQGESECANADAVYTYPANPATTATFEAAKQASDRLVTIPAGTLPIPASAVAGFTDGATYANYKAWIYDCESFTCTQPLGTGTSILRATENILVTPAALSGYTPLGVTITATTYSAPAGPSKEVQFLERLIEQFCPTWFDSTTASPLTPVDWAGRCAAFKTGDAQPGDVFPDSKKAMNQDLPSRLLCEDAACPGAGVGGADIVAGQPRYDHTTVLVIGSGVDHNAMTSQSAKGTIETWVHGGGTIVVFGSDEGNINWLQPLFHSAIRGGGGSISTPDQGHPILHTPNELDNPAENYDARDSAWRFNGQTAIAQDDPDTAVFSNVIVVDGDQTTGDPLLALSNTGSFGSGSIVITAYMPYDLYNDASVSAQPAGPECPGLTVGECEGLKFMHNLLMQGYGDLYLDYGPAIPEDTDVEPSVRMARIAHPEFVDVIDLTMIVYVW